MLQKGFSVKHYFHKIMFLDTIQNLIFYSDFKGENGVLEEKKYFI